MKILFRADAKPSIGIGDLMSLISLSRYFDEETFFIIRSYKAGIDLANKYNITNLFIIDEKLSLEEEINYINEFIKKNNITTLVLEITERKLSSYINLDENVKKVAINFDGNILKDLDLVIDWDVEAHKFFDESNYKKSKFLLGHEYVILPKHFYNKKINNRKLNLPIKKLLIAMGGADELNFTYKIVKKIIEKNIKVELNIIIGSGYEYKDELMDLLLKSNIKYSIKQNISNMLEEYLNSDCAISAGGLTASELVATKTPSMLIATYEHQIARCQYFDAKKWVKYLGFRCFDIEDVIEFISKPIIITDNNIFKTEVVVNEIKKISNS